MTDILLHEVTERQLKLAQAQQTHALLLFAPEGMGKRTIARHYAAQALGVEKLENYPYLTEIDGRIEAIGIEQIRALRQSMKRKTTGRGKVRRMGLLYGVDTMTTEAANALLKTLEEPPEDTVLILTANSLERIPLTIRSRVQAIAIAPLSLTKVATFFEKRGHKLADITRAYHIGNGRPALMSALLEKPSDHPLGDAISEAKQLLAAETFDRLAQVDLFTKDKPRIEQILFGLERIASSLMQSAAGRDDRAQLERAHRTQQAVQSAKQALSVNTSPKLVLTALFLNM